MFIKYFELVGRFLLGLPALIAMTFAGSSIAAQSSSGRMRPQTVSVEITKMGYTPASITLRRNVPARIKFLRTTDDTCATEVLFPDRGIRRELPLGRWVTVSFTPTRAGEYSFTCGMNKHRGKLIVR